MQAVDSILAQRFGGSFFSSFAGETSCSIFLSPMREELDWSKICTLHFSDGESCLHCSLFCLPEVLINSTTHWAASNLSCCLCESFSKAKLLRWNCTQFCRLKWHWCCGFVYVELFKDLKGKEDDECTSQVQSLGHIQRKYPGVQHNSDLYTVKRSMKECKFTSCALKWCRWKQQEVIFISKLCWCASLIGS